MSDHDLPARHAVTHADLHPLIATRWSPRAFDPTDQVDDETLRALLEAARWAPSSGNSQPWRFVVGRRGDAVHQLLFDALAEGNKTWAGAASILLLTVAVTTHDDGGTRRHALYDTATAVAWLTAQAMHEGLHVHQMAGFSADGAAESLGIDPPFVPVTMVAIGRRAAADMLDSTLAARETAPRVRLPLSSIAFGRWQEPLDV